MFGLWGQAVTSGIVLVSLEAYSWLRGWNYMFLLAREFQLSAKYIKWRCIYLNIFIWNMLCSNLNVSLKTKIRLVIVEFKTIFFSDLSLYISPQFYFVVCLHSVNLPWNYVYVFPTVVLIFFVHGIILLRKTCLISWRILGFITQTKVYRKTREVSPT
jgi:hypothetical protein